MEKHPDTQANYKADMDEARNKARRAIEATRAPTEAMLEAGGKAADWDHRSTTDEEFKAAQRDGAAAVWQAMIDEMLK
jgi:hypothetical protein